MQETTSEVIEAKKQKSFQSYQYLIALKKRFCTWYFIVKT